MSEEKKELKEPEFRDGLKYTWDRSGNCFVSVHVSNIPENCWDEWAGVCNERFSGQRSTMLYSDFTKARAYEHLVSAGALEEVVEEAVEEQETKDELDLLNPGDK